MTWTEFFKDVVASPQNYVLWLILALVLLFMISRFRNKLEEQSVDKAIFISRALVGFIMAFVVGPVFFYLLFNLIAVFYGMELISIRFLYDWIALTVSSYWWLMKCFFNSADLKDTESIYQFNAIIRIIWICLPLTLIWWRVAKTAAGKSLILPLIIAILVITRHKEAPVTFLTQNQEITAHFDGFFESENHQSTSIESLDNKRNIKYQLLVIGCSILIITGLLLAYLTNLKVFGLFLGMTGVMAFVLFSPNDNNKVPSYRENERIELLWKQFEQAYAAEGQDIRPYELSLKIKEYYRSNPSRRFPSSKCIQFDAYFDELCN